MKLRNFKNMKWMCFRWDINEDSLQWFDVLRDDLLNDITKALNNNKITDRRDLSNIVKSWAMYHYWSKCEYESIISDWPRSKNEHKMDVYEQLENNWDRFIDYIIEGLGLDL